MKNATTSNRPVSHWYFPEEGRTVIHRAWDHVAHLPKHALSEIVRPETLAAALDLVANSDLDRAADVLEEDLAYSACTSLGWQIHWGNGTLVAHVPIDFENAESKAELVVRAANALWANVEDVRGSKAVLKAKENEAPF